MLRGMNRLGLLTPPNLSGAAQTKQGSCTGLRRWVLSWEGGLGVSDGHRGG